MTSILAAAALGAWSYSGFLAETAPNGPPSPPPPSVPAPRPPAPGPSPLPDPPKIDEEPARRPSPPPASRPAEAARPGPAATPPPPVAAPPAVALRYRLADASGQLWEHADPDALRAFVRARNQAWSAPIAASPYFFGPSTCASGRCR